MELPSTSGRLLRAPTEFICAVLWEHETDLVSILLHPFWKATWGTATEIRVAKRSRIDEENLVANNAYLLGEFLATLQ